MSDYKISLGTELRTNELDKQVKDYKGKINVGVNTDSIVKGINAALSGYKASPIEVGTTLNTQGITDKITSYSNKSNRKNIKVGIDPDFTGVNAKIEAYEPRHFDVKVDLNWTGVAGQISSFTTNEKVKLNAELNNEAIDNAIKNYQAGKQISIDVMPNFDHAEATLKDYTARNKLNVKVNLLKGSINDDVAKWNKETDLTTVILDAKIKSGALSGAIAQYQKEHPNQCKIPIDLTLGRHDELDQKLESYKNLKEGTYIPVRLMPARDFDKGILNKPVKIRATLEPEDVETAINGYVPKSRMKVDVRLAPKDISGQIQAISKQPHDPIDVNVKLNDESVNSAIATLNPATPLGVKIKLLDNDINKQIEAIHPTSQIKVDVKLDNDVINEKTGKQNVQANKVKVGVKLDFNGVYKQIRKYQTKSRVKVDVELNESSIEKEIQRIQTNAPIKLGIKLDPNGVKNVQNQIDDLRQRLKNVNINIGGIGGNGGSGAGQDIQTVRIARGTSDATIAYNEMLSILGRLGKAKRDLEKFNLKTVKSQEDVQEIAELIRQIDYLDGKYKNLYKTFSSQFDASQLNKLRIRLETIDEQLDRIRSRALEAEAGLDKVASSGQNAKIADNSVIGGSSDANVSDISNIAEEFKEVDIVINATNDQINNLKTALKEIGFNSSSVESIGEEFRTLGVTVTNVTTKLNKDGSVKLTVKGLDQFKNAVAYVNNIGSDGSLGNWSESVSKDINNIGDNFRRLKSLAQEIGNIKIDIFKSNDAQEIEQLTKKLNELESEYKELFSSTQGGLDNGKIAQLNNIAEKTTATIAELKAELAKSIPANFGKYDAELLSLNNRFAALADKPSDLKKKIEGVRTALESLKSADGIDDLKSKNQEFLEILKLVKQELTNIELVETGANYQDKFAAAKEAAMRKLNSLFSEGSEAAKKYSAEVELLRDKLNRCGNIDGVQNVTKKINALGTEIRKTSAQTQTLAERLKTQFAKYSSYFSVASLFMYAEQGLRSMFEQVKLIDSAMTELKKVTNETDASYNKFLSNAASRAKELGTTIDGLVASTADFARLGYGFKESQGLAEVANIYAVVGDEIEGVEDATQSLVSTMAAFKDEIGDMSDSEFALSIVDKMNEVSNNFAISSGGIGQALQRSASSMAAANNTIDETIAMITAANEVAQNPEKVGNAMKTMSMRIRGAKTE